MNLRAAQKELRSRPPEVRPHVLVLEAFVVMSIGFALVGAFG